MSFSLPFCKRARIRFGDRVETVDPTYRIVDFGLEYQDGTIDSIAVGGNFHHLAEWTGSTDDAATTAQADAVVDTLERGVAVVRAAAAADAAASEATAS